MAFPTRVRRGASSNDYYYADGVNPMTIMGGGVGGILQTSFSVGLVTLSVADFDTLQTYFLDRKAAFDALAACGVCPTGAPSPSSGAEAIIDGLGAG